MFGSAGLLLSSFALHMAAPGQRLVPEPLTFASALLSTAMPQPATAVAHTQQWLLPSEGWASLSGATPPLNRAEVLQSSSEDARFQLDSFRGSLFQAALGVVSRASEVFAKLVSFPELFAPAAQALDGLRIAEGLPQVTHLRLQLVNNRCCCMSCMCANSCPSNPFCRLTTQALQM